jgi:hypothetical protein
MDITTLEIVQGDAVDAVELIGEEIGVAAPIEAESYEPETPELSIEELEEYFGELN